MHQLQTQVYKQNTVKAIGNNRSTAHYTLQVKKTAL